MKRSKEAGFVSEDKQPASRTIIRRGAKRLALLQKATALPAKGTITQRGAKRLDFVLKGDSLAG
jgi:hypothetical protein